MTELLRYKLTLAYRGTHYHGWQSQQASSTYKKPLPEGHGLPTIQETTERAMAEVLGHPVQLSGSSRTDSGVHAKRQVAHFDTPMAQVPLEGMRRAINARLPHDILIRSIEPVAADFNAIKDTRSKRYQYFIWNTDNRPVFFGELCWHRWQTLDFDAMRAGAVHLVGEHDFTSFAKPGHRRESTVRTIFGCDVSRRGPMMVIGVEGSGFLWNMVRIIVGTLVQVGLGRLTPDDVKRMLEARDRSQGGPTAPPQGLFLQWIKYDPPI